MRSDTQLLPASRVFFKLPGGVRPPCLPPRQRSISPGVERALRSWVATLLNLSVAERIDVSEWVSTDSCSVPHSVFLTVGIGLETRVLVIEKASERIDEADVRMSLRASALRSGVHDALTA
mgnify:CR=1 FL=1